MAGGHPVAFAKAKRGSGNAVSPAPAHPRFEPLPPLPAADLSMSVAKYLPTIEKDAKAAGKLVFHAFGDSGGIYGTEAQDAVAKAIEAQIEQSDAASKPKFLFHLGDIVYFNGEDKLYVTQFYEPYQNYNAPIFGIPGNHDGDTHVKPGDPADTDPSSLFGFMQNFCNSAGVNKFKHRSPMNQPYCYWTLEAPYVQIVGLYSNVDGNLDPTGKTVQKDWLKAQIEAVPADKWFILAIHHPCYSLDSVHGGYAQVLTDLDAAFRAARRFPDVVLSGHVHNYQRFSRKQGKGSIPYIINGNSGYANNVKLLHKLQAAVAGAALPYQAADQPDVSLTAFDEKNSGFLRVTASPRELTVEYFAVPFDGDANINNHTDVVTVPAAKPKTL
jgi:predicted phosphodiesterase